MVLSFHVIEIVIHNVPGLNFEDLILYCVFDDYMRQGL